MARCYLSHLARLAPTPWFGFVGEKKGKSMKTMSGDRAAAYLSSYFVRGKGTKATLQENARNPHLPRMLIWVSPGPDRRHGITMRNLRRCRQLWPYVWATSGAIVVRRRPGPNRAPRGAGQAGDRDGRRGGRPAGHASRQGGRPRAAPRTSSATRRGTSARDGDGVVDGWTIDVEGVTPCCSATLLLQREPVTCPGVVAEAFRCPLCDSLLRIGGFETVNAFELAPCPCELCNWNDVPTEGPLCAHCNRCEIHCDGDEYLEESPEAHQLKPA